MGLALVLIGPAWFGIWDCWDVEDQMKYGAVAFVLLAPVGMFLLIRAHIWRRVEKLDALARACSLTQPWPQMQERISLGGTSLASTAAVSHGKTPTLARARLRSLTVSGYRYPTPVPAAQLARPQMPRNGLVALLCWLVIAIPIWLIVFGGHLIPKGLEIRILRPGVQAPAIPGLQPILVRLELYPSSLKKDKRRRSLFINSQPVAWDDFDDALRKELGRRPPSWPVYLQADGKLEFGWPARAIDRIRGLHADVVLVTPPRP